MLILFVVITSTKSSLAYLKSSNSLLSSSGGVNSFSIHNGQLDIIADSSEAKWNSYGDNRIVNPISGQVASFGPVWVYGKNNEDLTSNIDLITEYQMNKINGTKEVSDKNTNEENICEPFEVIVGDVDNFGLSGSTDPYITSIVNKSMDIYPSDYDARGTDRRMVNSYFYDNKNKIVTKGDGGANAWYPGGYQYNFANYYSCNYNGYTVYYDGYTDRGMRGALTNGSSVAPDCFQDGVNWKYTQKAEPITFKYNNIDSNKEIKSVFFQIFIMDIQGGDYPNKSSCSDFQKVSDVNWTVTLKTSSGYSSIEVDSFSKKINSMYQTGPSGELVTLELPSAYYNLIKEASGLDSGLELLIDDPYTPIGDSYCIDFAKMTVNGQAIGTYNNPSDYVNGTVVDSTGKEIEGVNVTINDGQTQTTGTDGSFLFNTYQGTVRVKLSKDGYATKYAYLNTGSNEKITLEEDTIVMQEKYSVKIVATKCDLSGNPIAGENALVLNKKSSDVLGQDKNYYIKQDGTIVQEAFELLFEPNYKYKFEYIISLKSKDDIKDPKAFDITFSINNIKIKASQENNPDFLTSSDRYLTKGNNVTNNSFLSNSTSNGSNSNTEIYFEIPTTAYYWSSDVSNTKFKVNDTLLTSSDGTTTSTDTSSEWVKFKFNDYDKLDASSNSTKGCKIYVYESDTPSNNSGDLYWFTTQKVFICTN